jgi:hypothetical protein
MSVRPFPATVNEDAIQTFVDGIYRKRELVAPAQINLSGHHVRMQTVIPGTVLLE